MTQSIMINKYINYDKVYDFEMKTILEALIVGSMFVLAMVNLVRLNHFIP